MSSACVGGPCRCVVSARPTKADILPRKRGEPPESSRFDMFFLLVFAFSCCKPLLSTAQWQHKFHSGPGGYGAARAVKGKLDWLCENSLLDG